jgi:regulator of protease activity HflC (stomatin/prohibitin superfamily)
MSRLLDAIVEFMTRMRLWWVVDEYEQAGLFCCGRYVKTLHTGWHWMIPLLHDIEKVYIRARVLDIGNLSLPTLDGKVMAVSGNVEYEITDTRKALLQVYDRKNSLEGAARGIISQVIMSCDFSDGIGHEQLVCKITGRLAQKARKWGIRVKQFWFTELVPHRVLRLLQDNRQNEDLLFEGS